MLSSRHLCRSLSRRVFVNTRSTCTILRKQPIATITGYDSKFVELEPTSPEFVIPPYPIPPTPRVEGGDGGQTMIKLLEWIVKHEGKLSQKFLVGPMRRFADPNASDDGNWGGIAVQEIAEGEVIASIPVRLCIFPLEKPSKATGIPSTTQYYQGLNELLSLIPAEQWQVRLGMRLLAERAHSDTTHYLPYINALPQSFATVPLFFQKHEIEAAQYPGFLPELNARSSAIHKFTQAISSQPRLKELATLIFNGYEISSADLSWATAAVSSRAFQAPIAASEDAKTTNGTVGNADTKCLIPLIDLLNHSFNNNARITFTRDITNKEEAERKGRDAYFVQIKATQKILPGEEITINYFKPQDSTVVDRKGIKNLVPMADTETNLRDTLLNGSMKDVFEAGLSRARSFAKYPEGIYSNISSDDILVNFGYVPPFNAGDNFAFQGSLDYIDLALEMAHDYTYPHSYLAATSNPDINLAKRIPLVLPLPKVDRARDSFITSILNRGLLPHPQITWLGPNDTLMGILRACVLGARPPQTTVPDTTVTERLMDSEFSTELVGSEIKDAFAEDYNKLQDKAQAILATKGIYPYNTEDVDLVIFTDLCQRKFSEANEEAAMALLYTLCIMISGSFQKKLSTDANAFMDAIKKHEIGLYTSIQYAHNKKLLINHALHILATRLTIDKLPEHKWHKNLL